MDISRRGFFKTTATGVGASSLAAMGFSTSETIAQIREFKLIKTSETRNTCPYCSVGCGLIMYGLGDGAKNTRSKITHIEGDPDHPVNRGTLCPKGSSLIDFVNSPDRLRYPEYRGPGETEWKRVNWDWALDRIVRLMKDDRDKNFITKNGDVTVNRWNTAAFLAASASSSETGYVTVKMLRALGMTALDNQARV
jgi:formate dehydrogenase major subunit